MKTFEIKLFGTVVARVAAKNDRAARGYIREQIEARELDTREVIELSQRHLAIVDAETGKVIGGEELADGGDPVGGDSVPAQSWDAGVSAE